MRRAVDERGAGKPMTPDAVRAELYRAKMIAVLRESDPGRCFEKAVALAQGGVTTLEVTWTTPDAASIVRRIAEARLGLPGAGSIRTIAQAEEAVAAGARFLVSPYCDLSVAGWAGQHAIVYMPGALTPGEIMAAWRAGGRPVKVFPCSAVGGPSYIKSVLAPLPELELVPTGGVSLENMKVYLDAGAKAVGLGESFTRGEPADLVSRAREAVALAAGRP